MRLDTSFSDRLKWAIEHKKTTQAELSRHVGISVQAIQQWASGATSNPNREHLAQAASFLGVRYDWLCFGRGNMLEQPLSTSTAGHRAASDATALLAAEWEARLWEAMPADMEGERNAAAWLDGRRYNVPWLSSHIGAAWGLYRTQATLPSGVRARLWSLAIARTLIPAVEGRKWLLIVSPLEDTDGGATLTRTLDALAAEARVLNIEIVHAPSPYDAAALLAGQDKPAVPEAQLLGLEDSLVF